MSVGQKHGLIIRGGAGWTGTSRLVVAAVLECKILDEYNQPPLDRLYIRGLPLRVATRPRLYIILLHSILLRNVVQLPEKFHLLYFIIFNTRQLIHWILWHRLYCRVIDLPLPSSDYDQWPAMFFLDKSIFYTDIAVISRQINWQPLL